MSEKDFHKHAEELTTKAEDGDKKGLEKELHAMSPQDRIAMLEEMNKINEARRQQKPSLPDLQFSTLDFAGTKDVDNVVMKTERAWLNPARLLPGRDVYDPKIDPVGNGALQGIGNYTAEKNRQLAELGIR